MAVEFIQNLKKNYKTKIIGSIFNIFLICAILIGAILKFIISQSQLLSSDNVEAGIITIEMIIHHNWFLTDFYLPYLDPVYLDTIVFHVIPQYISNYDPDILRTMAYVIFCLTILVYSYLIYKITKNITCSLIFAALFFNITPLPYTLIFDWPTAHTSVSIIIGLVCLLLFDFPKSKKSNFAIALVLLATVAFSDSIVLPWLILPGLLYYLYTYWKKFEGAGYVLLTLGVIGAITFIKMRFIPVLVSTATPSAVLSVNSGLPIQIVSMSSIYSNIGAFFIRIGLIYNDSIYCALQTVSTISLIGWASILVSLGLLFYSMWRATQLKNKSFYIFLICSGITIFTVYVITDLSKEFLTLRYLAFFAFLIFVGIAIAYKREDRLFTILIIGCLILTMYSNFAYIEQPHEKPNLQQYELIDYLKLNQLNFGFGDFWDSNVITYLSKESVVIRPIFMASGQMTPMKWASSLSWYNVSSENKYFILVRNEGMIFFNENDVKTYITQNHTPSQILKHDKYTIYVFETRPELVPNIVYHQVGEVDYKNQVNNVSINDGKGYALYGPYQQFSKGDYIVKYNIRTFSSNQFSNDENFSKIDVVLNGNTILAEKEISIASLKTENGTSLYFSVPQSGILEFRVWADGVIPFSVGTIPMIQKT